MIPFVDLKLQYQLQREAFDNKIKEVCKEGQFILGPELTSFEERFAEYIGVRKAIGLASGTDALNLARKSLGIGPGDEVLIPANTFIASALSIYEVGAVIVPVDVDQETYLMDMADAEKRVTKRCKAIMPVHLYGQAMDMDKIAAFAEKNNLAIIEDACQAHGAKWKGRRVGSFGSVGCFSFFPSKNLGAFGDGGLASTNDLELDEKIRLLRNYGSREKYVHEIVGTNSRLDSLQAAILNLKLPGLDENNRKRFNAASRYAELLADIDKVKSPFFDRKEIERHVFHLFVIQCERRDELLHYLSDKGIQCAIHYPVPIHLHKAFQGLGLKKGEYPVSEALADKILSLPIFPEITAEQIEYVVEKIKAFYK